MTVARFKQHQRGVTLIEVLVAMFVMAVGILGIVGLQVVSLQNNRTALYRAEAIQLGSDIMDRIRANPLGNYAPLDIDDDPPSAPDCLGADCNADQMRQFDQAQWKCSLGGFDDDSECVDLGITGALPEGDGSIAVAGQLFTIRVQWTDPAAQCNQIEDSPELCFIELEMVHGDG